MQLFHFTTSKIPTVACLEKRDERSLYLPTVAIVRGPLGTLQLLGGAVWVEAKWCLALMGFRSISCVFLCQWSQWRRRLEHQTCKVQYMHEGYIDNDTSPFFWDAAFGWWEFRSHIQPRCKGIILRLQDSSDWLFNTHRWKHSNFVSFTGRHVRSLVTPIYQQRFEQPTICQKTPCL